MDALSQLKQTQSIKTANEIWRQSPAITCLYKPLNDFFDGGLQSGDLIEWGIPWGQECRELVLHFISGAHHRPHQNPFWCLWVDNRNTLEVYPPGWKARGVDLSYIRFATCIDPINELKAIFLEDFFKLIILDGFEHIKGEKCQFLAQMARQHRFIVFLLKDRILDSDKGNVWARRRLNVTFDHNRQQYKLIGIKGFSQKSIQIPMKDLGV